jgi:hypothetical protein
MPMTLMLLMTDTKLRPRDWCRTLAVTTRLEP